MSNDISSRLSADYERDLRRRLSSFEEAVAAETERCLQAVAEQRCERGTPWDLAIVTAMNAIRPGSAVFEPKDATGDDYDTRQSGDNSWPA